MSLEPELSSVAEVVIDGETYVVESGTIDLSIDVDQEHLSNYQTEYDGTLYIEGDLRAAEIT